MFCTSYINPNLSLLLNSLMSVGTVNETAHFRTGQSYCLIETISRMGLFEVVFSVHLGAGFLLLVDVVSRSNEF